MYVCMYVELTFHGLIQPKKLVHQLFFIFENANEDIFNETFEISDPKYKDVCPSYKMIVPPQKTTRVVWITFTTSF